MLTDNQIPPKRKATRYETLPTGAIVALLPNGYKIIVDECDREYLELRNWCVNKSTGYAVGRINGRSAQLHRLIMDAKPGQYVDHINRDRLDNRRTNLRFSSQSLNAANRAKRQNTLNTFKGVYPSANGERWVVKFCDRYCGTYDTELDAAIAYDRLAKARFGAHAATNQRLGLL